MIAVLAGIFILVVTAIPDPKITITSDKFIKALITDTDPEKYCIGEVLFKVKTREITPSKVISVRSSIIDCSRKYSRVYIVAEIKLKDGIDVGFYEAELIKDDEWKVYALRETMPRIDSFNLPGKPDMGSIYKESFYQFAQGDAAPLAGPARTSFKKLSGLKSEITNLQTQILFNNKLVIAQHTYNYDGRPVKVLTHYYKTSEGYKIVAIKSL